MNYRLNTISLEQMTLIKIAVALWNQVGVKASMRSFYESFHSEGDADCLRNYNKFMDIFSEVFENVPILPTVLVRKLVRKLVFIRFQILSWMDYHKFLCLRLHLPNEFCWTPQGELDFKKTAEVLVKDWNLDINTRFILACIYCFEDEISELWNKIPENFRIDCEKDAREIRQLVVFWTCHMKKDVARMHEIIGSSEHPQRSPVQYAFEMAAKACSKAALEYFLKKMNPKERKESLVRAAGYAVSALSYFFTFSKRRESTAVLFFLLSEMDESEQKEVFKMDARAILSCFLEWPRQSLLMEAAKRGFEFLSGESYSVLLWSILNRACLEGFDYREIFREFWKQSHDSHKKHAIDDCASSENGTNSSLLSNLFKKEDAENIGMILKSATAIQKERIIFSNDGKEICERLLSSKKWRLLKFFVGECISSKNTLISFKEELEAFLSVKEHLHQFHRLIDELIRRGDEKE